MSAHLLLDCVSKSFSDSQAPALDDVTLEVPAGSCTAVLGPSGSGKSTILRVMAGLDLVSSGQVLVDGTDVAGLAPERRGMGMVFQRPLLFPHLSVLDNVAFADRVSGVPRAEARRNAERYLDMVQLGGYGRRSVQELSGGQEQRVAIARALAAQPGVLLLDEPFSALDPALRSDMHELIEQIREALSPTIILVTHDRDEASAVADRIAVLHHGELLQHDTVDRVYNRPASLRVARLMGGLNEVPGHVRDGVHVSPIGRIVVDPSTPDGAGTLVVRQEAVIVAGAGAAAADGADGAGLADAGGAGSAVGAGEAGADGAGSAVGAGEAGADGAGSAAGASEAGAGGAGSAVGASDPGAGGAYRAAAAGRVEGWVSGIRRQGPRRMARVEFHGGVELCAEMPPGYPLAVGSRVAMSLAAGAASVVPSN